MLKSGLPATFDHIGHTLRTVSSITFGEQRDIMVSARKQ
jgi:hypothetical protein